MEEIFALTLGRLIFWLCLIPAISAVLVYWVTQHGPFAAKLQEFRGVVASYFGSVGIIFALFAAFLGADIWHRVQESNHSLAKEIAGV